MKKKNEINNLGELIRENNNNITKIINLLNQIANNLKHIIKYIMI